MLHCSVPTLIPHVKRYAVESFHPHTNAHCTYSYMLSSDAHKMHVSVHLSLTNCVYRFIFRSQIACICSSVAHKLRVSVHLSLTNFVYMFLLLTNCLYLFICCQQIACICSSIAQEMSTLSLTNCVYLLLYRSQEAQSIGHKLRLPVYL